MLFFNRRGGTDVPSPFSILVFSLFLTASMVPQEPASSHGLAWWVQADPEFRYCCTEVDCLPVKLNEVLRIDSGWVHVPTGTRLMDGEYGIWPSIDIQMWRCVYNGQMRCLFLPTGM